MERSFGKVSWIDLIAPSEQNLEDLKKRFKLHDIIVKELREPSARSKVENYGDYLYLIYYFPVYDKAEQSSRRAEIDFVLTKDTVISVHYEDIEPLEDTKDEIRQFKNSFELFYSITSGLLNFQDRQLRHVREKVEGAGAMLFKNKESDTLKTLSQLKRDISEYRIISRHQGPILASLEKNLGFFGSAEVNLPYMESLMGDHVKILNLIEDYHDAVMDYDHTNNQLMNLKINQAMKTFTVMSFMTFPFVLFVAIVDMNVIDNPFKNMHFGFFIVVGLVVLGMVALYNYFKNRSLL